MLNTRLLNDHMKDKLEWTRPASPQLHMQEGSLTAASTRPRHACEGLPCQHEVGPHPQQWIELSMQFHEKEAYSLQEVAGDGGLGRKGFGPGPSQGPGQELQEFF